MRKPSADEFFSDIKPSADDFFSDVSGPQPELRDAVADNPDYSVGLRTAPVAGLSPILDSGPIDPSAINTPRAMFTNEPIEGMVNSISRGLPATAGGFLGGAAGFAAGGPLGAMAGAALGQAAGESARQGLANVSALYSGGRINPPGQVLQDVAIQGAAGAVGEGAGRLASAAAPLAKKVITQQMRIGPNIPTKVGQAVLDDPGILSRAMSPQQMSKEYAAFEKANNLVSPRAARANRGELIFKPGQAEDIVNNAYQKLTDQTVYLEGAQAPAPITTQELYEASQAARFLRDQAKFGNQNQAANLANINEAKSVIDMALEKATEKSGKSYAALRQSNFESKAAQAFKSPYPLNLNREPNVLRPWDAAKYGSGVGAAIGTIAGGVPGAALGAAAGFLTGPIAVSPLAAGLTIKTANAMSPIAQAAAKGVRFAPGSIAAYYNSPGVAR